MKIAFLFLTMGDIYFPELWEEYFKDRWNNIEIFCHPKYPEKVITPWLKKGILPNENLVETKWGYLSNAYIELLMYSCAHSKCDKFIFISESCLPIKSFNKLYDKLNNDNIKTSYISHQKDILNVTPTFEKNLNKYSDDIKNNKIEKININKYIVALMKKGIYPPSNITIKKHTGWFCLSKYHVIKLLQIPTTYMHDQNILGDEYFLSGLINLNDNLIKEFKLIATTWNVKQYGEYSAQIKKKYLLKESLNKNKDKQKIKKLDKQIIELRLLKENTVAHPIKYTNIDNVLLNYITNSESFFFRKFALEENKNIITNIHDNIKKLIS